MSKPSTTASISGDKIISALLNRLHSSSLAALASELGVTNQAVQNWKNRKAVTPRQIAGLVDKARNTARLKAESTSVRPLVEFFPIKKAQRGKKRFEIFSTRDGLNVVHPYLDGMRKELEVHHGVYVFFDSRGHAIYAGKARRQRLWTEINLAFNREREDLQKIRRVKHPTRKNKYATSNEKSRQIVEISVPLHELASYFSAYEVADGMINVVEAMLVRSFANGLLNKRMERFSPPKKAKGAKNRGRKRRLVR